jgi:hypothetical protein
MLADLLPKPQDLLPEPDTQVRATMRFAVDGLLQAAPPVAACAERMLPRILLKLLAC